MINDWMIYIYFNNEKLCFSSSRDILLFLILLITSKSCVNSFFHENVQYQGGNSVKKNDRKQTLRWT